MAESLAKALHKHRVNALIAEAELIREWPAGSERSEQAIMLIREAMYRCAIGRLGHEEETRVFNILAFAMPDDFSVDSEPTPDRVDQTS